MPNRIIKESIKTSEEIDALSWFEEVFFYRLLVSCDDFGRYSGNPVILKNTLFPTKENVTAKSVQDVTVRLQELGLLYCYTVCGKEILQIATWDAHQQVRAVKSKYPDPPEDIVQKMPHKPTRKKRVHEDDGTCNQLISDDSKCDQEKSTESNCARIRNRNRESYSYSRNVNEIEGSATRAREPDHVDNLPIRIVPGASMRGKEAVYAND